MELQRLELRLDGPVARVFLNRPEVRNAFDGLMVSELRATLFDLGTVDAVRVIVLGGRGETFCAGADVQWMAATAAFTREENLREAQAMADLFFTVYNSPKPVVARVHGAALGGGAGLVAACDIAVAALGTKFGFTEVRLGIIPAVISPYVIGKIGESASRELFLTGERFEAVRALEIGLIRAAVPEPDLDAVVEGRVSELLQAGPRAVAEAKALRGFVQARRRHAALHRRADRRHPCFGGRTARPARLPRQAQATVEPVTPSRIGRYEIRRELGRGTMGVVYEALDPALDRTVALKTILLAFSVAPSEQEAFERRFFAEAKIAGKLRHPGIVVVHDVGRDEASGTLFIAFEHLEGRSLAQLASDGPVAWREALRIVREAALALAHAHSHDVVHRDIKPANIMLLPSGETKIMDFGIAKVPTSQLTTAGQVFGTPANMAPEQADGGAVDARSDLFSLGTVLYHLLTGRRAFVGDTLPQILFQVLKADPPPASSLVPGLPAEVDGILARLLAKDPAARYQDASRVAQDIEALLAGGEATRPAPVRSEATQTQVPSLPPTLPIKPEPPPSVRPARVAPPAPAARAAPALASPRTGLRIVAGVILVVAALAGVFAWRDRHEVGAAPEGFLPALVQTPAKVSVDFQHPLKDGQFQLWVDDDMAIDADLSGRVTKNVLGLKLRNGSVEQVLELKPGRHELRVRVAWENNAKQERTRITLEPGATRQLEVRLGRLRKDLSLEWK